jgi:hypothetical protein
MPSLRSFALLLAALLPAAARAQSVDSLTPRFTLGSTQLSAGYIRFAIPGLDAKLAAAGFPRVSQAAFTFGLGADIRRGRALLGGGYQSLVTRDHRDATYRTRMTGSYSLVDVGYAIVRAGGLAVYPVVGVGVSRHALSIRERGDRPFDDALSTPLRQVGMSATAALGHAGLVVERRVRRKDADVALSLRVGVTRTLGSQQWMADEARVGDGPRRVRATYARIAFSRPLRRRRDAAMPIAGAALRALMR